MDWDIKNTINRVLWIITVALIFHIGLSYNLWIPLDRTYPLIGLWQGFAFGTTITSALSVTLLLLLLLVANVEKWRYWGFIALAVVAVLLLFEDLTRLQVWFYLYLTILGIIATAYWQNKTEKTILTIQFAIAMLYIWTGLEKLNIQFITDVYSWFILIFDWTSFLGEYPNLGYLAGVYETLVGVFLIFPKTRKIGVVLLLFLHLFILSFLMKDNYWNTVVYPWNIAMIALVFSLFWKQKQPIFEGTKRPHLVIIVLFGIAPVFDFVGFWPHDFSFGMYSGMSPVVDLYFDDKTLDSCIPKSFRPDLLEQSQTQSALSLEDWAMDNLNVPTVGGQWAFVRVAQKYSPCFDQAHAAYGLEFMQPCRWENRDTVFTLTADDF